MPHNRSFSSVTPNGRNEEASGRGYEKCGQWLAVRDKRRLTAPIECAFLPGGTKRSRSSSSGSGESRCPDSDPCRSNMIRTLGVRKAPVRNPTSGFSDANKLILRTPYRPVVGTGARTDDKRVFLPKTDRTSDLRACRVGESERKRASAIADALFPYRNATGGRILRSIP